MEIDVVLFGLNTGNDLRIEYPELADNINFKDLQPSEVRFCWLVGNRTSPLYEKEFSEKISLATETCYPKFFTKPHLKSLHEGILTTELQNGIDEMEKFNPSLRLGAALLQRYAFDELSYIVGMKSRKELLEMNGTELKQYTDIIKSVEKEIPSVLKRIEGMNGISTRNRATKKKILVSINDGITAY